MFCRALIVSYTCLHYKYIETGYERINFLWLEFVLLLMLGEKGSYWWHHDCEVKCEVKLIRKKDIFCMYEKYKPEF